MRYDVDAQLSFIHGILSEPGEDAPRPVYADWLEEQGDPLGELVRLQVEMARPWASRARLRSLDRRERQLLDGLGLGVAVGSRKARDDRYGNLPHGVSFSVIDGLPLLSINGSSAPLPPAEWVERLGWFTARVGVYDSYDSRYEVSEAMIRRLLDWPGMGQCVGLDMGEVDRFDGDCDGALAAWPGGANLLRLGGFGTAVLAAPQFANLVDVRLCDRHQISGEAVAVLAALTRLRRLRISRSYFEPAGVERLARLSALRSLDLSDNYDLDDAAAHAIAAGELLELTGLDLSASRVTDAGALALLRSPNLPRLRRLNLARTGIGAAAVEELCRTDRLLRCGELLLHGCELTEEAFLAIARSPHARHLRYLTLPEAPSEAAGLALATSPHLKWLVKLFLAPGPLGPDVAVALTAGSPPCLEEVAMSCNPVGDRGALALAAFGQAHGNPHLDLTRTGLTDQGVAALTSSGHLAGLEDLWLDDNPFGDPGVSILAGCPDLAGLRSLWLSDVGMTDAGARALLDSPHLPRGVQFFANGNDISEPMRAQWRERLRG